jgi:prepilin-type N-terminal cleavage/methylation domain-containing protein
MSSLARGREHDGFSMIELLVTVVLAGIIFAAMVPFFANALKRTSGDEVRVDAASIAQDRIEQVRLLDFTQISAGNLNYSPSPTTNPFGDGRFGPSYTLTGESKAYTVTYVVSTPSPSASASPLNQKLITVNVSRPGTGFVTSAHTIVKDPAAGDSTYSDAEPTDLALTIYFDNYTYVKSPGVVIQRVQTNVTPNATTTPTPVAQMPNAGMQELTWTGLTGGPNYTYSVFCSSSKATYTMAAPPFRLWSTGRLKFDTYPGGD